MNLTDKESKQIYNIWGELIEEIVNVIEPDQTKRKQNKSDYISFKKFLRSCFQQDTIVQDSAFGNYKEKKKSAFYDRLKVIENCFSALKKLAANNIRFEVVTKPSWNFYLSADFQAILKDNESIISSLLERCYIRFFYDTNNDLKISFYTDKEIGNLSSLRISLVTEKTPSRLSLEKLLATDYFDNHELYKHGLAQIVYESNMLIDIMHVTKAKEEIRLALNNSRYNIEGISRILSIPLYEYYSKLRKYDSEEKNTTIMKYVYQTLQEPISYYIILALKASKHLAFYFYLQCFRNYEGRRFLVNYLANYPLLFKHRK